MAYWGEETQQGSDDAVQEGSWTRRAVLGGAGTAAGLLGLTGINVFAQAWKGQAPFQHQSGSYGPAMERVVAGDPVDIQTVYIHFGDGETYDTDVYNDTVESTLEQLDGLEVETYWDEIAVTPETWMEYEDTVADQGQARDRAEMAVEQVRSAITGYDSQSSHGETMSAIEDVLEHYGVEDIVDEERICGFVMPVGMDPSGREFHGRSFMVPKDSAQELANLAIHEYLHSFGIEHAYNPFDTMSYSPLNAVLDDFVTIPLTDETHDNWEAEKTKAEQEYGSA